MIMNRQQFGREERLSALLKVEIALLVKEEIKDPRLQKITITQIVLSKDYKYAHVYFGTLGDKTLVIEATQSFKKASGFMRVMLKKRLDLRQIPQLKFEYDTAFDYADHIARRLRNIPDTLIEC